MPKSMQRLDPGKYTINIGGTVYTVTQEDQRIATGRSKRGTVKQVWVARRDDGYVLEESSRYRDAKNAVFADAELAPEDRPKASVAAPVTHEDGTEQPSLFEGDAPEDPQPTYEDGSLIPTPEPGPVQPEPVTESPAFVQHVQHEEPVIPEAVHDHDNSDQTSFSWA